MGRKASPGEGVRSRCGGSGGWDRAGGGQRPRTPEVRSSGLQEPFAVRGLLGGPWGGAAVSALGGAVATDRSRRLWATRGGGGVGGRLKAVGMAQALAGAVLAGGGRAEAAAAVAQRGAPPLPGGGFSAVEGPSRSSGGWSRRPKRCPGGWKPFGHRNRRSSLWKGRGRPPSTGAEPTLASVRPIRRACSARRPPGVLHPTHRIGKMCFTAAKK